MYKWKLSNILELDLSKLPTKQLEMNFYEGEIHPMGSVIWAMAISYRLYQIKIMSLDITNGTISASIGLYIGIK